VVRTTFVTLINILNSIPDKATNLGTIHVGFASSEDFAPILAEMTNNKVLKMLKKESSGQFRKCQGNVR
jgi:hypothetical protein